MADSNVDFPTVTGPKTDRRITVSLFEIKALSRLSVTGRKADIPNGSIPVVGALGRSRVGIVGIDRQVVQRPGSMFANHSRLVLNNQFGRTMERDNTNGREQSIGE